MLATFLSRMTNSEWRLRDCGLAILLLLVWPAQLAWSAEEEPDEAGSPEAASLNVNVAVGGYPPYTIIEDGNAKGIMWDVLAIVAESRGYQLIPMEVPRTRVDEFILEGRLDASPRAKEWCNDPDLYVFSDPVVTIREVVFVRADDDFEFNELSDLEGKTIITGLGYIYPELESLFADGRAERFDVQSRRAMFSHLLKSREFDLLISEEQAGYWVLEENGWVDQFVVAGAPISEHPYRLMFNRRWEDFVDELNQALDDMKQSGELNQVIDKYR